MVAKFEVGKKYKYKTKNQDLALTIEECVYADEVGGLLFGLGKYYTIHPDKYEEYKGSQTTEYYTMTYTGSFGVMFVAHCTFKSLPNAKAYACGLSPQPATVKYHKHVVTEGVDV